MKGKFQSWEIGFPNSTPPCRFLVMFNVKLGSNNLKSLVLLNQGSYLVSQCSNLELLHIAVDKGTRC